MRALFLSIALVSAPSQAGRGTTLEEVGVQLPGQGVTATKGCGAFCVAIAARRAGVADVTFAQSQELTDPDEDGDCSLAEIVHALEALGIEAQALTSPTKTIPSGLTILHVRSAPKVSAPDHFVVAEGKPGRHRFYIPPIGAGVDDDERMTEQWNGDYVRITTESGRGWWPLALAVVGLATSLALVLSLGPRRSKGGLSE